MSSLRKYFAKSPDTFVQMVNFNKHAPGLIVFKIPSLT